MQDSNFNYSGPNFSTNNDLELGNNNNQPNINFQNNSQPLGNTNSVPNLNNIPNTTAHFTGNFPNNNFNTNSEYNQFNNNTHGNTNLGTIPNNNFNSENPNYQGNFNNSGFSNGNNLLGNHPNSGHINNTNESLNNPNNNFFDVGPIARNNVKLDKAKWIKTYQRLPNSDETYDYSVCIGYLSSGGLGIKINVEDWKALLSLGIITKDQKGMYEQAVLSSLTNTYLQLIEDERENKWIFK